VHETLARLENKASTEKLAEQEAESKRKLDEAERLIREAEGRALEAERRFREASVHAAAVQEVPVQDTPDVAAMIQAACAEAARVERERVEALAIQHIQQQKAEDEARHESERAAWAQQAQAGLEVQQQTLVERLKASEAARVQEREAASNMQKFQAAQIRNLRASPSEAQPSLPAVAPDPATQVKIPVDTPQRTNLGDNHSVHLATWSASVSSCERPLGRSEPDGSLRLRRLRQWDLARVCVELGDPLGDSRLGSWGLLEAKSDAESTFPVGNLHASSVELPTR
jgi:hypothetical protein